MQIFRCDITVVVVAAAAAAAVVVAAGAAVVVVVMGLFLTALGVDLWACFWRVFGNAQCLTTKQARGGCNGINRNQGFRQPNSFTRQRVRAVKGISD